VVVLLQGPLGERGRRRLTESRSWWKRRAEPPEFSGSNAQCFGRGDRGGRGAASGGVPNALPRQGAARIIRPARLLGCKRKRTWGPSGAMLVSGPVQGGRGWRSAGRPHSSH